MRLLIDGSHVWCPLSFLITLVISSRAITVVLIIANLILVLTCLTTSQYLSFLFLAMRSIILFTNCLHSLDSQENETFFKKTTNLYLNRLLQQFHSPPDVGIHPDEGIPLHVEHFLQIIIILLLVLDSRSFRYRFKYYLKALLSKT